MEEIELDLSSPKTFLFSDLRTADLLRSATGCTQRVGGTEIVAGVPCVVFRDRYRARKCYTFLTQFKLSAIVYVQMTEGIAEAHDYIVAAYYGDPETERVPSAGTPPPPVIRHRAAPSVPVPRRRAIRIT